ncbi:F420-0:Gamma-glutamyl ligase [Phormidium willei BDU 130791]|nr:F420-0:Gamma-glutamyl ligase [Phormidium willei BDU 130791]
MVAIDVLLGIVIGIIVLVVVLGAIALDLNYRRKPGNQLEFRPGTWAITHHEGDRLHIQGDIELFNATEGLEIMVPDVNANATLLSNASVADISCQMNVIPAHEDAPPRPDGYWFPYIIKARHSTHIKLNLHLSGPNLDRLQTLWLRLNYLTYGPGGRIPKTGHIVFPLQYPDADAAPNWLPKDNAEVFPVKTHLLTHLDDPVEVIRRYVMPHAQSGDIVTIGETPLAIIQGRLRDPITVKPGWLARRLCYWFLPTSSLATACGLQTLIDQVGAPRVFFAFLGGVGLRLLGQRGGFYRLAGEQARLIDDVTGTLPPYDQFIVLGPDNPQAVVDRIQKETGLSAAIVDVNDLQAVKVLAATPDVPHRFLETALRSNPAGNADEQTPVVLIRPRTA